MLSLKIPCSCLYSYLNDIGLKLSTCIQNLITFIIHSVHVKILNPVWKFILASHSYLPYKHFLFLLLKFLIILIIHMYDLLYIYNLVILYIILYNIYFIILWLVIWTRVYFILPFKLFLLIIQGYIMRFYTF